MFIGTSLLSYELVDKGGSVVSIDNDDVIRDMAHMYRDNRRIK